MPTCSLHQIFVLIAAWLFDAIVGDPEKLPHPVRAIGTLIARLEHRAPQWFNNKKSAGVFIGIFIPATAYLGAFFPLPWPAPSLCLSGSSLQLSAFIIALLPAALHQRPQEFTMS